MAIDIAQIKLSAQVGLLGNVFPMLRAVCVDYSNNCISVLFYCDGKISFEDRELCESTMDTIHSDFILSNQNMKKLMQINCEIFEIPYPNKINLIGHLVYYRNENSENYI